ncbi:hypothetical protein [Kineococcus radiotolerans]|uniref:Integral membrane protein n=1 Tax=Kineococcus radiotolerans (strain ATCC BAA-149 / DSM 14245 / SRS30216) TaxID=266940 RepID=A6WG13_KINRD|nr:hypothetical protein [Kineococcus radiotolerans]ABS05752.1 conserved hypothetical protein [Kineococcus radiotolerans SRS30216 = ATCC BAA-149]
MTSDLDTTGSPRSSAGDRARTRAYARDFFPAIAGYVVAVVAVGVWGDLDGDGPWRYAWALLPVLPAALLVRAVARGIRRSDEYARLLQLGALAVSFAATMLACVLLGMLTIAGLPLPAQLLPWLLFAAGMLSWIVAAAVTARR